MKKTIIVFFILLLLVPFRVSAEGILENGWSIPQREYEDRIAKSQIKKLLQEPKKQKFRYFDVNENGMIALIYDRRCGAWGKSIDMVVVYSDDGEYQYGHSFAPGIYGVAWEGDQLFVFAENSAYLFNEKSCYDIKDFAGVFPFDEFEEPKTVTVGDVVYRAAGRVSPDESTKIIKENSNEKTVVFQAEDSLVYYLGLIGLSLFAPGVSIFLFFYIRNSIRRGIKARQSV